MRAALVLSTTSGRPANCILDWDDNLVAIFEATLTIKCVQVCVSFYCFRLCGRRHFVATRTIDFTSNSSRSIAILLYFLTLQNAVAWTNLGVLYLRHGKADVSNNLLPCTEGVTFPGPL